MVRWQVSFPPDIAERIARWAADEFRDPRDQIRFLVERELAHRDAEADSSVAEPALEPADGHA